MVDTVVPLVRLGNHHKIEVYQDILREISDTESWALGPYTERFEMAFGKCFLHKYAVGVSNGTDAIRLFLNTTRAREVWMSDTTFVGVWCAAQNSRDVKVVRTITPDDAWDVTTNKWMGHLRADARLKPTTIIITHLYGSRSNVDIEQLKSLGNVTVIEDMSQCHGLLPSPFSDAQIYSFYPTKNLGALGEGGIVTTDKSSLAEDLRRNRFFGYNKTKTKVRSNGCNYKMDEIQAAFLMQKLLSGTFDNEIKQRRILAAKYLIEIGQLNTDEIIWPAAISDDCVYHLMPVWVMDREKFRQFMSKRGISTGTHYPLSVETMTDIETTCKNTSSWNDHVITLPMGGYHTLDEINYVCEQIKEYANA
jgi:dTDP-4-amino-4,6-dideoxygalactose transaminase